MRASRACCMVKPLLTIVFATAVWRARRALRCEARCLAHGLVASDGAPAISLLWFRDVILAPWLLDSMLVGTSCPPPPPCPAQSNLFLARWSTLSRSCFSPACLSRSAWKCFSASVLGSARRFASALGVKSVAIYRLASAVTSSHTSSERNASAGTRWGYATPPASSERLTAPPITRWGGAALKPLISPTAPTR